MTKLPKIYTNEETAMLEDIPTMEKMFPGSFGNQQIQDQGIPQPINLDNTQDGTIYAKVLSKDIADGRIVLVGIEASLNINDITFGNQGIQFQYNSGTPRGYIGDGSNAFFSFDGTKLTWKATNTELDASGNLIASSATISGAITATSGAIGGWAIVSGYIYNLQSGTPTSSPSDGLVLASGNEALIVYENTEKRVEVGYLSSGVYGIKVYADDGSTVIFEASDTQKTMAGGILASGTVANVARTLSYAPNLILNKFADFEQYANNDNIGAGVANGTAKSDTGNYYFGTRCLEMVATGANNYVYLGSSTTDYNLSLLASTKYLISFYAKGGSGSEQVNVYIKQDNAGLIAASATQDITTSWARYTFSVTTNASLTDAGLLRIDNDDNGATIYIDGIQIEIASGASSPEASKWTQGVVKNVSVINLLADAASTNEFVSNTAQIKDAIINNAKITDLAVGKLTAGRIASQAIVIGITATEGDGYIAGGTYDVAAWTATGGFIFGFDDSDGDKLKMFFGDATTSWDWNVTAANTLTIKGVLTIISGTGIANLDGGDLVTMDEDEIDQTNLINAAASGATVGAIFGTNISGGGTGNNQVGNNGYITTITDSAITVTNLAAINADLGSITAGNITIDSSGYIKTIGVTSYGVGAGIFLGYDTDAYKLHIGNPDGDHLSWDGTVLNISGGYLGLAASNDLLASADTARSTDSLTYVKLKEITIDKVGGDLRIKFDLRADQSTSDHVKGRIYRNGVAVGTEQTDGTGGYVTKSEDIGGWKAGDKVQLYAKQHVNEPPYFAFVRNFRIYGTYYKFTVNTD